MISHGSCFLLTFTMILSVLRSTRRSVQLSSYVLLVGILTCQLVIQRIYDEPLRPEPLFYKAADFDFVFYQ